MGNKSKQRVQLFNKQGEAINPKWRQRRDMAQAGKFAFGTWQGMASPALQPPLSTVGVLATDVDRAHPLRHLHSEPVLRVLHAGRTLRNEPAPQPVINPAPQPWQKRAARLGKVREAFPRLAWDARRTAREARVGKGA